MNCNGCGVELDPSEHEVNQAVDQVLTTSIEHAKATGGVCPLCGHSKAVPYSQKRSVLFALLIASLLIFAVVSAVVWQRLHTDRGSAVAAAIARLNNNADATRMLGTPITADRPIEGTVNRDETGWQEARLVFPAHGPNGTAQVQVVAGKASADWQFKCR